MRSNIPVEERKRLKVESRKRWRRDNPEKQRKIARENSRKRRAQYPGEAAAYSRKWRADNPEKSRAAARRQHYKQYGLTPESKEQMLLSQGNKCAICASPEHHSRGWHTDHDHETGVVRGILCHPCNLILHHRITPEVLRAAADYLEKVR